MISSSSPPSLGPGVGSVEALLVLSFWGLPFPFFAGASVGNSRFLCWPLVARPERRGSSGLVVSMLLFTMQWSSAEVSNTMV